MTSFCIFVFLLSEVMLLVSGCSEKSNTSTGGPGLSGTIKGTATLPAGVQGDLLKARANLYNNPPLSGGHTPDKSVSVSGTQDSVTFSFSGLPAGDYYIEVWKDSVSSGSAWQTGDLVGWYGAGTVDIPVWMPVSVKTSLTSNVSIVMHSMLSNIHGTVSGPNDYSNTMVSIYSNYTNWLNYIPAQSVMTIGSGSSVTYSMTNIAPGTYFLDVWKDNDLSGNWTTGDFVGWYGTGTLTSIELTPIEMTEFSNIQADISMNTITK